MRPQGAAFEKEGALGSDSFRTERRVKKSEHLLDLAVEARFVKRVGKLLNAEIPFHLEGNDSLGCCMASDASHRQNRVFCGGYALAAAQMQAVYGGSLYLLIDHRRGDRAFAKIPVLHQGLGSQLNCCFIFGKDGDFALFCFG